MIVCIPPPAKSRHNNTLTIRKQLNDAPRMQSLKISHFNLTSDSNRLRSFFMACHYAS